MKRLLSLVLIALMMVGLFVPLTANAIYEMYIYTPNGGSLNVRNEPSSQGKIIQRLPYGEKVAVDHDLGNGWAELVWGNDQAFVQTRYLVPTKPAPVVTPSPATPTPKPDKAAEQKQEQEKLANEIKSEKNVAEPFYVAVRAPRASSTVNFRVGPSKITARISAFSDGKELIVEGETNKWYRARDPENNTVGYIFKEYTVKLNRTIAVVVPAADTDQKLGTLTVNGAFDLTCRLPADYKLQAVNIHGDKIVASVLSDDMTRPQMYLTIAYDEMYADVERMNDLSDADLAVLEATFSDMDNVDISYSKTGHGTKLLVARQSGAAESVDILAIYKGYFIEFIMTPNPMAARQVLTNEQIGMCIDFLTDLDFNPVQ